MLKRGAVSQRGSRLIILLGLLVLGALSSTATAGSPPVTLDQGWNSREQQKFYTRDQGSRIMPLRWMQALKQSTGDSFMAQSLSRYGYLPNENSDPPGLPVGFTVARNKKGEQVIGMTCAACHTRQIEVAGTSYRIDGGPAITDIQKFLYDLGKAVEVIHNDSTAFPPFAQAVLGRMPPQEEIDQLRNDVDVWYKRYDTLMTRALPAEPWGIGRLDAVGMIFNRLAGLDIGLSSDGYMIPGNIKRAEAPVRYPFLWNASKQDKTQWLGFAPNGNGTLGLTRNLGEVYGVFADFYPEKDEGKLVLRVDYLTNNSANFHGLNALEELIEDLEPPKWPWKVDQSLADAGKEIFERDKNSGGCTPCHAVASGKTRYGFLNRKKTWATPISDEGTDSRAHSVLTWKVQTGILRGARIPLFTEPLDSSDTAVNVLRTVVIATVVQHHEPFWFFQEGKPEEETPQMLSRPELEDVKDAFKVRPETEDLKGAVKVLADTTEPSFAYESRVLEGIWAAAPYLHNGSVPTLDELLKPAADRVSAFKVGPEYDPINIGLAVDQQKFNYTLKTTDCGNRNSGNSRCGHEFGTTLLPAEKKALLEYLKTL